MWVCRAGQEAEYIHLIEKTKMLFLPWENYNIDLTNCHELEQYKMIVSDETKIGNKTSVSNWAGQLYTFVKKIEVGDLVMVPHRLSQNFILIKIVGDYEYLSYGVKNLHHARKVEILANNIPKAIFDQNTQYSLRAYRTLFKVRDEDVILKAIRNWKNE